MLLFAQVPNDPWTAAAASLGAVGLMFWLLMHYVKVVIPRHEDRIDAKEAAHREERVAAQRENHQVLSALVDTSKEIKTEIASLRTTCERKPTA